MSTAFSNELVQPTTITEPGQPSTTTLGSVTDSLRTTTLASVSHWNELCTLINPMPYFK